MEELAIIPETRREAAHAALRSAFGSRTARNLTLVRGGVSGALILRFELGERAYVLRIEPSRVELADRRRNFACMGEAAAAGVAPPVHYCDPLSGVSIMDFIAERPLAEYPGGAAAALRGLGFLIRKLQAVLPFPTFGIYPDAIQGALASLRGSELLAPGEFERHAAGLARIKSALPWDPAGLVASHNDPNPRNILFDGTRLWLVDWELAFSNDPLVDVAIVSTDLATTPELETAILEAALGSAPDRFTCARLTVIRLLTRLFYGSVVLGSLSGVIKPGMHESLAALTPGAFRAAVAEGRLASGTPETGYAFARMSLRAFVDGLESPEFGEVLKLAAQCAPERA